MGDTPNVSNSLTVRVQFKNNSGMLGRLTSEVGRLGGDIGADGVQRAGESVHLGRQREHGRVVVHDLRHVNSPIGVRYQMAV